MNTVELSHADHSVSPPFVHIPQHYNAAYDLLMRNKDRGSKIAYICGAESLTYQELTERSFAFANGLKKRGFKRESRVMLCMLDTLDWPVAFLGCVLAGVVPVCVNTLLTSADFEYMLRDSRADGLLVSSALLPAFEPFVDSLLEAQSIIVSDTYTGKRYAPFASIYYRTQANIPESTTADEMCFWLYSSGSTGRPKGTVHLHSHLIQTAELYANPVLQLTENDVCYSAAKLFFAYGLGNALSFPLSVGATTVLLPERPTPAAVFNILKQHQPTVFYGVPTLYAALLAEASAPTAKELKLRLCASAGEALPAEIGKRFTERYGVEILDGIGSTEMLHIFLSNRAGAVRYGTTGTAIPGYKLRLINDEGKVCADGKIGELQISGPSAALMYWNQREKTKATFAGEWTRSGDKYVRDADGYYTYSGRTDDMLKVGGIYVSPFEVEAAVMTHTAVLEAAVIGVNDSDGLTKPKAYVVLKNGHTLDAAALQAHVKQQLAPYKYPRWVEFVSELPKTATGKIQRFKLRAMQ
jgi:benzoate-CoA ligase